MFRVDLIMRMCMSRVDSSLLHILRIEVLKSSMEAKTRIRQPRRVVQRLVEQCVPREKHLFLLHLAAQARFWS